MLKIFHRSTVPQHSAYTDLNLCAFNFRRSACGRKYFNYENFPIYVRYLYVCLPFTLTSAWAYYAESTLYSMHSPPLFTAWINIWGESSGQ